MARLATRRLWDGVGACLICASLTIGQVSRRVGARLFSNSSLYPLHSPAWPRSALGLGKLHLHLQAPVPTERYNAASQKVPQRERRLLFARCPRSTFLSAVRPRICPVKRKRSGLGQKRVEVLQLLQELGRVHLAVPERG